MPWYLWYLWYLCKIHIALVSCWRGQCAALGATASCAAPRSEHQKWSCFLVLLFGKWSKKTQQTSKMKQQTWLKTQYDASGQWIIFWCQMMSGLRRWCNDIRSCGLPGIAALPMLQLTMQVALVAFPLSLEGWSMVLKPVERLNSETLAPKTISFLFVF